MNTGADVRSLEALQEWYANLTGFGAEAKEALGAVTQQVHRAVPYLEDQIQTWGGRARVAWDEVVRAKAELNNRRQPNFDGRIPDCTVQERALRRAEAKLAFCQRQQEVARRWLTQLPRMIGETYDGPSRRLVAFLEGDLPKALAELDRKLDALERYVEARRDDMPGGLREERPEEPS